MAGSLGLFAFNSTLDLVDIECRHLDKYSYGLRPYDRSGGHPTVSSKDQAGAVVNDSEQAPPVPCTQTYGP